jgi:hypothetical protein
MFSKGHHDIIKNLIDLRPTFLYFSVVTIPITKNDKKVGFHLSYEYITTKIASISQNIYLEKYISFIR